MKFLAVNRKGRDVFCTECGSRVKGDYFFLGIGKGSILILCKECFLSVCQSRSKTRKSRGFAKVECKTISP